MKHFNLLHSSLQKNNRIIPAAFGALLCFHAGFANGGYFSNDDMVYAKYANGLLDKTVTVCNYCNHFQLRLTPVFITFLSYKLLGITDFSSAVYSLITTLITGFMVWLIVKKESVGVQLLALSVFFFSHSVLARAHCISADTGISCFLSLAYYFYYRSRFFQGHKAICNGLLTSFFLFLCVLTKETVIIFFPFWLLLFVTDLIRKQNLRFWIAVLSSFFLLTFFYLLYFKITTGDWLYRYHLLIYNSKNGGETYASYGLSGVVKRITYELWYSYLLNGDMQYIIIASCGFMYANSIAVSKPIKHILFSFFMLLLCSNFMSFSVSEYSPLWPDPRHFLFLVPFASVAAGFMLKAYLKNPGMYALLPVLFLVASAVMWFSASRGMKFIYFALTLLFAIVWLQSIFIGKRMDFQIWIVPVIAILGCNYLYDFAIRQNTFFYTLREIVQKKFSDTNEKSVVFTGDVMTAAYSEYFLRFNNQNILFSNLDTCTKFSYTGKLYTITNSDYNTTFAQAVSNTLRTGKQGKAVTEASAGNTVLYRVTDTSLLHEIKKEASSSF